MPTKDREQNPFNIERRAPIRKGPGQLSHSEGTYFIAPRLTGIRGVGQSVYHLIKVSLASIIEKD
jgi:hypothetical protein